MIETEFNPIDELTELHAQYNDAYKVTNLYLIDSICKGENPEICLSAQIVSKTLEILSFSCVQHYDIVLEDTHWTANYITYAKYTLSL